MNDIFQEEEELYLMNELKRIEAERKERERVISQDVQKFVQQQEPITQNQNHIQRTPSSSSRRSSANQDHVQRSTNSSNRSSTTQKLVSLFRMKIIFPQ